MTKREKKTKSKEKIAKIPFLKRKLEIIKKK